MAKWNSKPNVNWPDLPDSSEFPVSKEDESVGLKDRTITKGAIRTGLFNELGLGLNKTNATTDPTVNNDISEGYSIGSRWFNLTSKREFVCLDNTDAAAIWKRTDNESSGANTQSIIIACSDETTILTAGVAKVTFRMPYAFTLSAVRASLTEAATGATLLTVDINENGSSILSTKLTIDASEKTSTTAATPAVISDSSVANDAEITIDIDAVGNTTPGKGLKVYLIGTLT